MKPRPQGFLYIHLRCRYCAHRSWANLYRLARLAVLLLRACSIHRPLKGRHSTRSLQAEDPAQGLPNASPMSRYATNIPFQPPWMGGPNRKAKCHYATLHHRSTTSPLLTTSNLPQTFIFFSVTLEDQSPHQDIHTSRLTLHSIVQTTGT